MIYFSNEKLPFMEKIENPLCVISDEEWAKITPNDKLGVEWDIVNGEFILIKETEEYKEEKRREKEAREQEEYKRLKLTRGDVLRGLLRAKGITKDDILNLIEQMPEETDEEKLTKQLALIDFEDALDFYRANPLVDVIGNLLNISSEKLTAFFKTNDYEELL